MKRWLILWMIVGALAGCESEPALVRQIRIERLIGDLREALLESVEAEKSAVLATTDEESQTLADETERLTDEIDRLRGELRPLIIADERKKEIEALDAFDAAWKNLEAVDRRLLALAVANTNLKAMRLAAVDGGAALDRLAAILTELQGNATSPETIRALSQAGMAAYRLQSVVMVHIATPDDAQMTRLEQQITTLGDTVDQRLAGARDAADVAPDALGKALQAWSDYRHVVDDVLRLSRQNTNVISSDVSIHEKRRATKACLAALDTLARAVQSRTRATR